MSAVFTLSFAPAAIAPIIAHARAAESWTGADAFQKQHAGLILKDDDGYYLVSNGLPENTMRAYAEDYEPAADPRRTVDARLRDGFIPIKAFAGIMQPDVTRVMVRFGNDIKIVTERMPTVARLTLTNMMKGTLQRKVLYLKTPTDTNFEQEDLALRLSVRMRHPKAIFLNDMPFDDALAFYISRTKIRVSG